MSATASVALANFTGNDTQNFNPTANGIDFVTVQSTQVLEYGFVNTGFFVNQAKNSLPDTVDTAGTIYTSDDMVTFGDIGVAYGIARRSEIGISFSYLIEQQTNRNQPGAQFASVGLNEIKLSGKYNFFSRNPIGFALIPSLNLNQSRNNPFSGTPSRPTANLEMAADTKFGDFLWAVNLGYRARTKGDPIGFSVFKPLPNQIIGSTALNYYLQSLDTKFIAELYAAKATESVDYVDSNKISSEYILGAKIDTSWDGSINVGAGSRAGEGLFTPDWRVYAGLNFNFDFLERKASAPVEESKNEVPAQIVKKYIMGYKPEDIEKLKDVEFDEMRKNYDFPVKRAISEKDIQEAKPPFEVIRLDTVDFDFGSSNIKEEHKPLLDKVARYLAAEPKILKMRIEGHTDSVGSEERNASRSQGRAEAIREYLIQKGNLDGKTMQPMGYGSSRPIADNSNFQGRKQNRRVEIRILRKLAPLRVEETH